MSFVFRFFLFTPPFFPAPPPPPPTLPTFYLNVSNFIWDSYLGILLQIQDWFDIKDDNTKAGLLQSIFMCSYMVLAPLFGYMGDRFSRKYLMSFGILIWSASVYASTMMSKGVSVNIIFILKF